VTSSVSGCPRRFSRLSDPVDLADSISLLRGILLCDGIWVGPSDTIYGLSGSATSPYAAERIRTAKQRNDKPFIYLVSNMEMANRFVSSTIPGALEDLFASGDVTLILPSQCPAWGKNAALRVATDPLAKALVRECDIPLISTSANLSHAAYVDNPDEIYETFRASVDLMIDVGPLGTTQPSTILNMTGAKPVIVREGKKALEVRNRLA